MHVDNHCIELFMKFEQCKTHEEMMDILRRQAKNPNARFDAENPWAKIAVIVLKSRGKSFSKLKEKVRNFRITLQEEVKQSQSRPPNTTSLGFVIGKSGQTGWKKVKQNYNTVSPKKRQRSLLASDSESLSGDDSSANDDQTTTNKQYSKKAVRFSTDQSIETPARVVPKSKG